ncbi:hypothetical protein [Bradyrhizobium guangxiense]|nr:hypothetical protein [Bradyrhizobium guangxiense]
MTNAFTAIEIQCPTILEFGGGSAMDLTELVAVMCTSGVARRHDAVI